MNQVNKSRLKPESRATNSDLGIVKREIFKIHLIEKYLHDI